MKQKTRPLECVHMSPREERKPNEVHKGACDTCRFPMRGDKYVPNTSCKGPSMRAIHDSMEQGTNRIPRTPRILAYLMQFNRDNIKAANKDYRRMYFQIGW